MGIHGIPIGNGSSSSCKWSTNSWTAIKSRMWQWEFTGFFGFPSFACWLFMFYKKGEKNCFFTTIVWMVKVALYSYLLSTARESVALRRCLGYPLTHDASDHSTRRMKKSYPFSCEAPKSEASQLHVFKLTKPFRIWKVTLKKTKHFFFSKKFSPPLLRKLLCLKMFQISSLTGGRFSGLLQFPRVCTVFAAFVATEMPILTRLRCPPLMPRRSTLPTKLCCTSTSCMTFSTSSTMYL